MGLTGLQTSAQKTHIWCGTLIDGISNPLQKNMTIVAVQGKVSSVQKGIELKSQVGNPGVSD